MPAYESNSFRPPAPVALVSVRSPESGAVLPNIAMLLDSGADVSLLPREPIAELIRDTDQSKQFELESFDGTRSMSTVVDLELVFLGKSFRGQFLLFEGRFGIIGRNILNNVSLVLDGPSLTWSEIQSKK
jgi:hypothetical protein